MTEIESDKQARAFGRLYERGLQFLSRFGKNDAFGNGDFWLLDDNYGGTRHKIYFFDLKMLSPVVVYGLQKLLEDEPDWAWVIAMDVTAREGVWPEMGLIVRKHEIIDGLQRQYFPPEYQNLKYEGARVGTDRD